CQRRSRQEDCSQEGDCDQEDRRPEGYRRQEDRCQEEHRRQGDCLEEGNGGQDGCFQGPHEHCRQEEVLVAASVRRLDHWSSLSVGAGAGPLGSWLRTKARERACLCLYCSSPARATCTSSLRRSRLPSTSACSSST